MSTPAVTLATRGYFLAGEFRTSGQPLEVRSPWDGALVATTFWTPEAEIETAIGEAQRAFREIAALPAFRRAEILRKMSEGVAARRDEISMALALEAGKPIKAARLEADRAVFTYRNASEEAQRIESEFIPLDLHPAGKGRWGIVRRFPLGPVYAITPFNFPSNLVAHKLGPAFAAGNSVLLKPSLKTPISGLLMAEIAHAAGVPAGALSVLLFPNERAEQFVADERFRLLTFTGSAEVGWRLKSRAGKKRVALELGGNAGCLVAADADLDFAAERCVAGGFGFSGQSCISVQRIFAHRTVLDGFLAALTDRVQKLRVGNPLDEFTDVGPLITADAAARVEAWVSEAVAAGAKALTGGKRDGGVVQPTVLTGTRPEMRVNCREIFGPVVTVEPYDDFEKTLAAVNDSPFGLQAGVFTRDLKAAFRAYEQLDVGAVVINDVPTFRVDHMPYGGAKDSGTGREGGRYAIEEMTERKLLVLNLDS
jgi:acyl-CoA reductase-like NAD-dependent aldehyde dehydrogenase